MINKIRNARSQKEIQNICAEGLKNSIEGDIVNPRDWDEVFLACFNNAQANFINTVIDLKDSLADKALNEIGRSSLRVMAAKCHRAIKELDTLIVYGMLGELLDHIITKGISWEHGSDIHQLINLYADTLEKIKETGVPVRCQKKE